MGHVDHGKTTLLDYIRKKRVAATEAGGITQHIRAWEVDSKHGKIVFLDTPGHEAFSYLRQRGASVTDLVVLVVAADDGIKPQTIEAIEHAKNSGVPIIVAINKIDKVSTTAPIETIKRQLAERDLLPEEWGGSTVIVPISAKTGQGVDELLEMIVLQSELMELKTDISKPAKAFVLESHFQKGYGAVSTIICAEGTLHQGDYFTCGKITGKVRILISSTGKRIESAGPSIPVMVVGFDTFPEMGDWLTVLSQKDYLLAKAGRLESTELSPALVHQAGIGMQDGKALNLIIKTDTRGSKEAITNLLEKLEKLAKEVKCSINIVLSSIGDITFSDVELAENTDAVLIGLHVRAEKNAQLEAKQKNLEIHFFDVIYKMIDFLKELVESKREILKVWNKVGEAEVRKVFVIENAVIAGCYLKEGVLSRGNKVECLRRGKKVGEGKINSLQRDRKTVKEIHAGYECGFVSDLFNGWEVGDTVICYAEGKAAQ
jgi:translation initiation factor IF-2